MNLLKELERSGALVTDRHFVYAKGGHGSDYIDKRKFFPDPILLEDLCRKLLEPFAATRIDTVVGPAAAGIPLAYACARLLAEQGPAHFVWADKAEVGFELSPSFLPYIAGKHVLVVEDILNSGGSIEQACDLVRHKGAKLVGVSAICNRGGVSAEDIGVRRLCSIQELPLANYQADRCPLCERGEPIITNLGHGSRYRQQHPDYHGGYFELTYVGNTGA